jgi:transglutaminase-like putative cysteine protease
MAVLLLRHYSFNLNIKPVEYSGIIPKKLFEEQWMGVYHNNKKIGYSRRNIEKWGSGYKISETLKMGLAVMGSQKEVETITDAYLNSDLRLNSFDFILKSDVSMVIKGKVDDRSLNISMETLGMKSEQKIHLKDEPYLNISMIPNILKEGIRVNKKFDLLMFDPSTMSQERMTVEVVGREQIQVMGEKKDAFKIKGSFKGIGFFTWLTENGEVLKEESPLGFVLIKETKEVAMRTERPSGDIISQVSVPFNLKLPHDTKYLKVRLSGIDLKRLELDGGRQKLIGDVLEIKKEAISYQPSAISSESKGEYLKDSIFIQSKNPQITSLARDIVKDEKDKLKAARLIYDWVHKNIEKVPTITIPTATEVLRSKRGDCNEHTTLFTALSRAAGIPTKIAIGFTYKDGYFYYHAWPEIFLNDWIAIDPTLGQFPADAAHIRITTGDIDKQIQIVSVVGKIKIEGLEYR